jgi:probable addiction module antidote protein
LKTSKLSIPYDEVLDEFLREPATAIAYLNEALAQEDEPEMFLVALRNVSRAYGMGEVARRSKRTREGLYRTLSRRGHPQFDSILAVLAALGFKLVVERPTRRRERPGRRKAAA